jgi:APA family basic amino acid/polyamine antiporter
MLQLPRITWIRFGIWLLLGLVIYFLYGYRHSVLRNKSRAVSNDA